MSEPTPRQRAYARACASIKDAYTAIAETEAALSFLPADHPVHRVLGHLLEARFALREWADTFEGER
jgi:hypothetical protein